MEHVTAAVVTADGSETIGDTERVYRLASLTKPMVAWAVMIGVEEGIVALDAPLRFANAPDGVTLRHLLAHAGGFGFDGDEPIAPPARRRIYSNTGIERAADELAGASGIAFADYLREAVWEPLGMSSATLDGSPAHGARASSSDAVLFVSEMLHPRLLADETYRDVISTQFAGLAGIVPDVGRFDPCPWGLGVEIRGDKSPHWTGRANSSQTFGHFGGSGTMMWVDPSIDAGVVALSDRPFPEWRDEALVMWPQFSDAVVAERRAAA
ncbi:MAG TPA: serine hydrolase domain-containing protein [Ilumatobacter sp.]